MARKFFTFVAGLFLVLGCVSFAAGQDRPRYVFLFIGDGMGPVQRNTSNLAARSINGKDMTMETFPARGQIHTRSANSEVTDSAAAATALATGVKTNNGVIGQLPDGTAAQSISAILSKAGYRTGIITSEALNGATPAGFYAHAKKRSMYNEIAKQVPGSGADLVIGNGLASESEKQEEVIEGWKAAGVATVTSLKDAPNAAPLVAVLKYPSASSEKKLEGPGGLANSIEFAISRLKGGKGFFIMAEGAKIDSGGHNNRASQVIDEAHALDRAVKVAYEFYRQNPEETLIVVAADHETGGMTLQPDRFDVARLMATGDMSEKMTAALGKLPELTTEAAVAAMAEAGLRGLSSEEKGRVEEAVGEQKKSPKDQVVKAGMLIAQERAGITWTTGGHTGVDVPVTAVGVGAASFVGTYDNTEIPKRIMNLMVEQSAAR